MRVVMAVDQHARIPPADPRVALQHFLEEEMVGFSGYLTKFPFCLFYLCLVSSSNGHGYNAHPIRLPVKLARLI